MGKLSIGIDISMDSFHACARLKVSDGKIKELGSQEFNNTFSGYEKLKKWALKRLKEEDNLLFVMEATGIYYENLAHALHDEGFEVSVLVPNVVKHFGKSMNIATKTDKYDSFVIAQMGIERSLPCWQPVCPEYKEIKGLCRELMSLKKQKGRAKNQYHALEHSHNPSQFILKTKKKQIDFYAEAIIELKKAIQEKVKLNPDLYERVQKITTIKGVGFQTAITIICETNGFKLFTSSKQLVSYAGLDVVMNQSGIHEGKTRISKKGNAQIRHALFFPALSAIRHGDKLQNLHKRVTERNPNARMKGVVACMRKMLILIYTLWKKNEEYDPNHKWNRQKLKEEQREIIWNTNNTMAIIEN